MLALLPDVVSLSLDCLTSATNLDTLHGLRGLREFRFDIFALDCPDILAIPALWGVECLVLGQFRKPDQDLQHLQAFTRLRSLHVTGQHRHLEVVAGLPHLRSLALSSLGKAVDLSCVSRMAGLEYLRLFFGGRADIDDIVGDALRNLHIVRVRGLESVGDLRRFPRLEHLMIEDQIRIASVACPDGGALTGLFLNNCKTLQALPGLAALPRLEHLRIHRTAIAYDALVAAGLPATLRIFGFHSGKIPEDRRIRADLDRRGFAEHGGVPGSMPDF